MQLIARLAKQLREEIAEQKHGGVGTDLAVAVLTRRGARLVGKEDFGIANY